MWMLYIYIYIYIYIYCGYPYFSLFFSFPYIELTESMFLKKKKKLTCGDQLLLEVLSKLDRLGLWLNNPVRGRVQIRGLSLKEEINVVLQEE